MSDHFDNSGDNSRDNSRRQAVSAAPTHTFVSEQPPQVINITCPPPKPAFPLFGCLFFLFAGAILLFFFLFLVGLGKMAADELAKQDKGTGLIEKRLLGDAEATAKVLVLEIQGIILDGQDSHVWKQVMQAADDADVKAIVVRVDSPGGSVSGSDYFLYLLKKLKKEKNVPVIVSMGGVAASGGYYVSMVGDEIYAEPSTLTGSIGVIFPLYNGARFVKMIGIESTPITSGPLKSMGGFAKRLTEEERAVFQSLVDDSFALFKKVIREGREEFAQNPEKLDALATGQVYTAQQALENRLIDKIGYLDDAIEAAMDRAGLAFNPADPKNGCKVVRFKKQAGLVDIMIGAEANAARSPVDSLESAVVDLTTPRAYFLCPGVLPVGREGGN